MSAGLFTGTADHTSHSENQRVSIQSDIAIQQGVQSIYNLVTIDGVGQGKVRFDRDGSFKGAWAMGDKICEVVGRARGDRNSWTGDFTIYLTETSRIIVTGSFSVEKTNS